MLFSVVPNSYAVGEISIFFLLLRTMLVSCYCIYMLAHILYVYVTGKAQLWDKLVSARPNIGVFVCRLLSSLLLLCAGCKLYVCEFIYF